MNFLFWNVEKKPTCYDVIIDVVEDNNIDVIAIAEFPVGPDEVRTFLNKLRKKDFNFELLQAVAREKVLVFFNKTNAIVKNQYNEGKVAIKMITTNTSKVNAYVAFCHLESKVNINDDEQAERVTKLKETLCSFENDIDDKDGFLLLCGDLNMNPFEKGLIKANGLNAVMDSSIAKKKSRKVQGQSYKFFYNPMWGFLGDLGKGNVSGTYYFNSSNHIQYFWNVFDQVLLRPEAIPYFEKEALDILTSTTHYNLLKKSGAIDDKQYSDHLPIIFKLNI